MPPEGTNDGPVNDQVAVKICGLDRPESVDAAVQAGAQFTGFVFYAPSPRNLSARVAADLIAGVPSDVSRVGLFVDPADALLDEVLSSTTLDLIQLHGSETVKRINEIKRRTDLPVVKVLKIEAAADIEAALSFESYADWLLFDAKAPATMDGALPGGNALAFDWRMLSGRTFSVPWMLAGGLTAENVGDAIKISGAKAVDVSSGVEDRPGVKNVEKIRAFIAAAHGISAH